MKYHHNLTTRFGFFTLNWFPAVSYLIAFDLQRVSNHFFCCQGGRCSRRGAGPAAPPASREALLPKTCGSTGSPAPSSSRACARAPILPTALETEYFFLIFDYISQLAFHFVPLSFSLAVATDAAIQVASMKQEPCHKLYSHFHGRSASFSKDLEGTGLTQFLMYINPPKIVIFNINIQKIWFRQLLNILYFFMI